MPNYCLCLSFDGTCYHGWQLQETDRTVQGEMEQAAGRIFSRPIRVSGCSRTDAGVHANRFICNFHAPKQMDPFKLQAAMNFYLPDDISVLECQAVPEEFHARFSCLGKEYLYQIWNGRFRNPFLNAQALHLNYPLDERLMHEAAQCFTGTHDFSAFCASGSSASTTVRTVTDASVVREGDRVLFRVSADGFLYNMVRIMAGTLIYVANGKISPDALPALVNGGDRKNAGYTVPAQGLYLNRVFYKEGSFCLQAEEKEKRSGCARP